MGDIVLAAVYGRAGKEREAEHYLKSYLESLAELCEKIEIKEILQKI